jgi:hypothetical protein
MLVAEPREPEVLTHLLVGGGGEDDVPFRLEPLAGERGDRDGIGRHLALHVERTATPHVAVANLAGPRIDRPLGRICQNSVRVGQEQEPRRVRIATGDPRHEVGTIGDAREQRALDAERLEVPPQELRRDRLVAGRVDRVEAEQAREEPDHLVPDRRHSRRIAAVSRSQGLGRQAASILRA